MFEERSGIITISTVGKVSHLICLGRKHWSHFASFRLLPWDFGTAPRYTKAISKRGVKMLAIRKLSKYEFSGVEKHCPPPNLQGHRATAPNVFEETMKYGSQNNLQNISVSSRLKNNRSNCHRSNNNGFRSSDNESNNNGSNKHGSTSRTMIH